MAISPYIKTLIVDDEEEAREGLKVLLAKDPEVTLLATCKNGLEAIGAIHSLKPDLVFLDIQMPEVNGFEVLNSLKAEALPLVIFATAYDQYALQAFEVHAVDYLLKPFSNDRFYQALFHAKQQIRSSGIHQKLNALLDTYQADRQDTEGDHLIPETNNAQSGSPTRLVIKSSGKIYFIPYDDILWVEAFDYYVKIHTGERFYLVRETMKRMETRLPTEQFVRIHKSSIINLDYIKEMEPYFSGEYVVHLQNGQQLKLSRNYRNNLLGRLEE